MRETFLPVALPCIGEEEKQEVLDTLSSGWVTTGPKTRRFEQDFARYVGTPHAIGLNSCTAALHLSLVALGIGKGDEVITTPLTFCATVNVILHQQATPILADVSPDIWNIDPAKIEAAITPNTKAIIPVHYAGHPCEMEPIQELANKHNLALIEDAAHAVGAKYKGRQIGNFGDTACFSFYAIKNLTTGEGGMLTTAREELVEPLRMLSLHGMDKNAHKRYSSEGAWYYDVMVPGYKCNMTDIQAAMGIHQLAKLEGFTERRTQLAMRYRDAFASMDTIRMPQPKPYVRHAWHLFAITLRLETLSIDRSTFIQELRKRNIGTTVNFIPIHLHPFYKDLFGDQKGRYPEVESIYEGEVTLPLYPGMDEGDVDDVVQAVEDVCKEFRR